MFSTISSFANVQVQSGASGRWPYGQSVSASYSPSAIHDIIHFALGTRTLYFRFDLLNNDRSYKSDLTPWVTKATINCNTMQPIQRSMDIDLAETVASKTITVVGGEVTSAGIDYLNDLVCPVAIIKKSSTEWLWFPMGAFRYTRPGITVPGYAVVRHNTMPDLTSLVQESFAIDASTTKGVVLTLPKGDRVIDVIRSLLMNSPDANSSTPDGTPWATPGLSQIPGCALGDLLPSNVPGALAGNTPGDWPSIASLIADDYPVPEGTSYLELINHLLWTINCWPLQADERGIYRVIPWPTTTVSFTDKDGDTGTVDVPDYTGQSAQWTYDTESQSIITFGLTEEILIDNIANIVQVRVEDGNRTPFMATAINRDASSPYNVDNWAGTSQKRRLVKTINDGQVPDSGSGINPALQYAVRELCLASWLTDEVTVPIAVNPLHAGYTVHDVVKLNVYQSYYSDGVFQHLPIIALDPGLTQETQLFLIEGWSININLPTPGSGSSLAGNIGLTTLLEPRDSKQGHTMTLSCHRITKTFNPNNLAAADLFTTEI